MSDSEIKLRIIRLIVSLKGDALKELYQIILSKLNKNRGQIAPTSLIEHGYKEMSEDPEREKDAFEWIEGNLNSEEL